VRRYIGRLRLHAGKYILGTTAPTGTGVQALPRNPLASSFDSMPRYKVRTSAQAIEKDFPHIVQMIVPLGGFRKKLDDMSSTGTRKRRQAPEMLCRYRCLYRIHEALQKLPNNTCSTLFGGGSVQKSEHWLTR
jgi:hypothetical protein